MKVNKSDISTMVSCIDNMHKQLSYASIFNLNIIKLMNERENNENEKILLYSLLKNS